MFAPGILFKPIQWNTFADYENLYITDKNFYNIGPWGLCFVTYNCKDSSLYYKNTILANLTLGKRS